MHGTGVQRQYWKAGTIHVLRNGSKLTYLRVTRTVHALVCLAIFRCTSHVSSSMLTHLSRIDIPVAPLINGLYTSYMYNVILTRRRGQNIHNAFAVLQFGLKINTIN